VAGARRFFVFDDFEPALPRHFLHGMECAGGLGGRGVGPVIFRRDAIREHDVARQVQAGCEKGKLLKRSAIEFASFVNAVRREGAKCELPNELCMPEAGAPLDEKRVQKR
jgi:hypothetical protein